MRSPNPPVHVYAPILISWHKVSAFAIEHVIFEESAPQLEPAQLPGLNDAPKDHRVVQGALRHHPLLAHVDDTPRALRVRERRVHVVLLHAERLPPRARSGRQEARPVVLR